MSTDRARAAVAGALYLLTVVTSVPALALKAPVLRDPATLAAADGVVRLQWAAVLELVLALACVGTAVALYPLVRRVGPSLALGFVCSRTLEAALVVIGVVALLSLTTVTSGSGAAAPPDREPPVLTALVAVHDWTFLLGPGLLPAVNALLLGSLLLRSGRVPRLIPLTGLVGAPLLLASALGTVFGVVDQVSTLAGLAALPVAAWEISLGVCLLVRGLRPLPATTPVRTA